MTGDECGAATRDDTHECLNMTWWANLLDFAEAASARVVLGLSMNTGEDRRRRALAAAAAGDGDGEAEEEAPPAEAATTVWDATNARALLAWTIAEGRDGLLAGLELGNEQNSAFSGDEIAADFEVLDAPVRNLWPDEVARGRAPRRSIVRGGSGGAGGGARGVRLCGRRGQAVAVVVVCGCTGGSDNVGRARARAKHARETRFSRRLERRVARLRGRPRRCCSPPSRSPYDVLAGRRAT